uniref:Bile acid-CoA:amino acid N-acyltransferase n=1 Tax=Sphenodon punctatus TaxID=8508 RepID=A0A8D0L5U9_SPHPU
MVRLAVTPTSSLVDEPVKICISGLAPSQLVTLQASLTDEKGLLFHSRAFYQSNGAGEVDLERDAATGGNYSGVQPMGLFWSLQPEKPFYRLTKRDVMHSPFWVCLDLFDSFHLIPPPSVRCIQIREGRVRGALFLPPGGGPFPGVIDMFGGIGGLLEFRASLLASRGFAALALAYFAYEDLPSFLAEVDLEYFEEAAELLLKHPKVGGTGVGIVSVCKGAEIALAMATFLPQITATVCINGTNAMNGTGLRYRDLHIEPIPYQFEHLRLTDIGLFELFHAVADTQTEGHQDSILPVEKAKGKILFIVGESDRNYNSKAYAEESMERMRRYGKKHCTLLSYPGAGHLIEPPGSPFCRYSRNPFFDQPLMWGGEAQPHAAAQEHSWREIQKFLWQHLGPSGSSKL